MLDKDAVARQLAVYHSEGDPAITRIIRLVAEDESQPQEPVKLLEVNPETFPAGILPIAFVPDPPDVPCAFVVVEVTDTEYRQIEEGELKLPAGWDMGDTLYAKAG